ncbi:MAG: VOC family protein [Lachnospiraceae bacterium]|nr:VOC family protein [Lachnospiraceae bacterium]
MNLKNILIVVSDMDRSKRFYHDLFGLQVMRDFGDNVMLTQGLVLQERKSWEELIGAESVSGNGVELFFEEPDWDSFMDYVDKYPEKIEFIGEVRENPWGRRAVMLKDPDGHIIEVAEKI